jgi:hypothetical protein
MHTAYLEKLNPQQRRAVEHGVQENACIPAAPLLVIAGAGSGKTNTLAHRVAHLIVNGADPRPSTYAYAFLGTSYNFGYARYVSWMCEGDDTTWAAAWAF